MRPGEGDETRGPAGDTRENADPECTLHLDEDGVVQLTWAVGLLIDRTVARRAMARVDELNRDRARPLCVHMAGIAGVTRDGRRAFTEPCSVTRVALVGRSAVETMIADFTMRVIALPIPVRFFTSPRGASRWLLAAPR